MSGKPLELYTDNAAEFKSEALRRGCEQHGIRLRYRPGRPHYGGIVERVIGTMMQLVHELPGTTFSSAAERGSYDSARAVMTLAELQRWLALAVACYHGQVHETLGRAPAAVWAEKAAQDAGYCDALRPWIARRGQLGRFILRRDPRDVSRVWALDAARTRPCRTRTGRKSLCWGCRCRPSRP